MANNYDVTSDDLAYLNLDSKDVNGSTKNPVEFKELPISESNYSFEG